MRCDGRRVSFAFERLRNLTLIIVHREQGHRYDDIEYQYFECGTKLTFEIEYHLGLLKGYCQIQSFEKHIETNIIDRKLARLRAQLLEPVGGAGGGGAGFDVSKSGDARVALVGFPSVGKSTFLSKITKTKSEAAAYSFTTLTAIPGVLEYGGAEIQILDLPGIIEGASEGKGRGRQVISAAKVS